MAKNTGDKYYVHALFRYTWQRKLRWKYKLHGIKMYGLEIKTLQKVVEVNENTQKKCFNQFYTSNSD